MKDSSKIEMYERLMELLELIEKTNQKMELMVALMKVQDQQIERLQEEVRSLQRKYYNDKEG